MWEKQFIILYKNQVKTILYLIKYQIGIWEIDVDVNI
jgi:hypothetical protein